MAADQPRRSPLLMSSGLRSMKHIPRLAALTGAELVAAVGIMTVLTRDGTVLYDTLRLQS